MKNIYYIRLTKNYKIMQKKYKLTKKSFTDWLFDDMDDVQYWGIEFIRQLREDGKINTTIEEIFENTDTIPIHILENYSNFNKKEVDQCLDGMCTSEIELIK